MNFLLQWYWGGPFPIIFDEKNKPYLIFDLPLTIPLIKDKHPSENWMIPLDNLNQWVNITRNGKKIVVKPKLCPNDLEVVDIISPIF